MHGDGYETRQVFLFHLFVCIFGLDDAQNTPFFKKITNRRFSRDVNAANLMTKTYNGKPFVAKFNLRYICSILK